MRTAIWKAMENSKTRILSAATTINARLRLMYDSTGLSLFEDDTARQVWMQVDPVHADVVEELSSETFDERFSASENDDVSISLISVVEDSSMVSRKWTDDGSNVGNAV